MPPANSKPDPSTSLILIGCLNADCPIKGIAKIKAKDGSRPSRKKGDPVYMRRESQRLWTTYRSVDEFGYQVSHDLVELLPGIDVKTMMGFLDTAASWAENETKIANTKEMETYRKRLALWNAIEELYRERQADFAERTAAATTSDIVTTNVTTATQDATATPVSVSTKRKITSTPKNEDGRNKRTKQLKRESEVSYWFN
ncbi:MAG: hypothetical protein M1813_007265 [Trichoglossum hirsutum]|nr:MAG: hypothetical protein M1813_007265 [Trichoglossum hirsutum]